MTARLRSALAGEDGSVTVEAALGIASIVTVLVLAVAAVGSALTQLRLVDAAREAARVAALSGPDDGRVAGEASAPDGAVVSVTPGESVVAEVRASGLLPGLDLVARAVARTEPGVR